MCNKTSRYYYKATFKKNSIVLQYGLNGDSRDQEVEFEPVNLKKTLHKTTSVNHRRADLLLLIE